MPPGDSKQIESVTLRDGTTVTIRPIRPDDAPRLQAFHARLSPESIYMRFLDQRRQLSDPDARRLVTLDDQTRMAWVATREQDGDERILGVARYDVIDPNRPEVAEAAIIVEDRYQGKGLGTLLVERLVAYARAHGIREFVAEVSVENYRMLRFIQRTGLPVEKKLDWGMWDIHVKLESRPDRVKEAGLV